MNNTVLAYSTSPHFNSYDGTFYRPILRGWGDDDILPAAVAYELHQGEMRQTSLETTASFEDLVAVSTNANSRQSRSDFLPPVLPTTTSVEITGRPSFIALQEWEGTVTSVGNEGFTARVMDLTHPEGHPDEEAEFPMSELSDDDISLVTPGAFFRWSVGITRLPGGGKRPTSQIVFRRLPKWTRRDIARSDAVAREIINSFECIERSAKNEEHSAR